MKQTCIQAREAALNLAGWSNEKKNQLLLAIRDHLKAHRAEIAQANAQDLAAAQALADQGKLSKVMVNRLKLQDDKIDQLFTYLDSVAKLPDPVGKRLYGMRLDQGLELERVSCPLGVLAVIFEARPEVVVQVSALSLKSGNAVILKGGSEAANSNQTLHRLISEVTAKQGLPGAVGLMESRDDVAELLRQEEYVDLIIPRGSNDFVRYIQNNTKIPVLGHAEGICHLYLDATADPAKAVNIALDAKLEYPSACNAMETLLVHEAAAPKILPELLGKLAADGVELRTCPQAARYGSFKPATEADWATEYTDLILAVKVVKHRQEAVDHINRYGSGHTDSIVTEDIAAAEEFMNQVDSACVFHNASTRLSDGYVFGLGAEVGISTNKTHARGPVGLEGLVIYKYKLRGQGQVRATYQGKQGKPFLHEPL